MIRQAREEEIGKILEITRACAKKMTENAIFHWNAQYPSREAFENDVARGELFVLENHKNLIGNITISTFKDGIYNEVEWLTENSKPSIYIHRLAVHPDFQGQGNAQKLMLFTEKWAKTGNFQSVRLDTFSQNMRNQRFYEQRGYKKLGSIYFPKQSKQPFYCYELALKS